MNLMTLFSSQFSNHHLLNLSSFDIKWRKYLFTPLHSWNFHHSKVLILIFLLKVKNDKKLYDGSNNDGTTTGVNYIIMFLILISLPWSRPQRQYLVPKISNGNNMPN